MCAVRWMRFTDHELCPCNAYILYIYVYIDILNQPSHLAAIYAGYRRDNAMREFVRCPNWFEQRLHKKLLSKTVLINSWLRNVCKSKIHIPSLTAHKNTCVLYIYVYIENESRENVRKKQTPHTHTLGRISAENLTNSRARGEYVANIRDANTLNSTRRLTNKQQERISHTWRAVCEECV